MRGNIFQYQQHAMSTHYLSLRRTIIACKRTARDRARPTGGAATTAQEGEGLQSVDGRVCHHTAQIGRVEGEEDNGTKEY